MPSHYSYVHRQPGYWKVRYDSWNGWEAPHIHASQGDRELQVYTNTLEIKHIDGRFSAQEIEEIKDIARSYANNYCMIIYEEMFDSNNINELQNLKELLNCINEPINEPKKYIK